MNEGGVHGVAFSPDGKTLAAGISRGEGPAGSFREGGIGVVLWDVAARRRLADVPLPVKEGVVEDVAFSPDGGTLAAGFSGVGRGSGVVLWDVARARRLADVPLPVKEGGVYDVAFSPDGETLAAGFNGRGSGVVLWDAAARGAWRTCRSR